jgi:hypothetical protein
LFQDFVSKSQEGKKMNDQETIRITSTAKLLRFKTREEYEKNKDKLADIFAGKIDPKEVGCEYEECHGNIGLNAGLDTLVLLLIGNPNCQAYGSYSRIWVGDGDTPAQRTQTSLQGENQAYAPMDEGFPRPISPGSVEFQATFDEETANFPWREWGVDNGPDQVEGSGFGGKLLNRKVHYWGTKQGGVWVFQVRISFA